MFKRSSKKLTDVAKRFLVPINAIHRQYEALRAFFVDHTPSADAAKRFGYTANSFRVLCHHFRRNPDRQFFLAPSKGPKAAPKKDRSREEVVMLRKQNYSIYDISHALEEKSVQLSPGAVSLILKEEGFARLPRRAEEERLASSRPAVAEKADVRQVSLQPRTFRTRFGGLFLFLPFLAKIPFDAILQKAGFPGTKMIPAANAMRSLLALKLFGSARHSHVMSDVFDEGLALFAGLNLIPKRAFLTEYSCRIDPSCYPEVMRQWFDAMSTLGLERGLSFDIDFHTIPYHGDDALVEKHYVSKRSRRQKGILAFVAQDATTRVFCYANGTVTKEQQNDEILRFVEFWKQRTGHLPKELVFDSKLTTYQNLNKLNKMGINFMTLRRRTNAMLRDVHSLEPSAWRQIQLENVARAFKTPKIIDERIRLTGYDRSIRQIVITELGHEEPTFLLTNQMSRSPAKLIGRYAQRMIIENNISDGIDFFHMDALSSAVPMKINCDLQLTLMASSLYRLLGSKIGNPYQKAKSRHIFRDFINATATICIGEHDILVRFQKRAHNPLLLAAGFDNLHVPIPWLHNRRLAFLFG